MVLGKTQLPFMLIGTKVFRSIYQYLIIYNSPNGLNIIFKSYKYFLPCPTEELLLGRLK